MTNHQLLLKLPLFIVSTANDIVLSNYFLGAFEADMIRINKNGMVWEYELKASLSDFRADFRKTRYGKNKHDLLREGKHISNYFVFVVPKGIIPREEIPDYAGLIEYSVSKSGYLDLRTVKKEKRLHKRPYEDFRNVAMKLAFRDYNTRRNNIYKCYNAIEKRAKKRQENDPRPNLQSAQSY
jgi:hypothetical protein